MSDGRGTARCEFEHAPCNEPATTTVRTVLGLRRYCGNHGAYIREIEREWDRAEQDYYDQRPIR